MVAVRVEMLGSGSRGNCTLVASGRTRILVDAGLSARETERRLARVGEGAAGVAAILVTHEHSDHVAGVAPLARRHGIPVACTEETWVSSGLAEEGLPEWIPLVSGRPLHVGDLMASPFSVPHDATCTVGFRLSGEGVAVGYATDLGHVTDLVRERLRSVNVLVIESNHDLEMLRDGPYSWPLKQRVGGRHGHLSNEAACALLEDVVDGEAQVVALAHLSLTNNQPSLVALAARDALERAGRDGVRVVVASQDEPVHVALA